MDRGAWYPPGQKDSFQFSGHQGFQQEQSLQVRKHSIYFTNFPDGWVAEHLWKIFKNYGDIVDVYIPVKRNIKGQRYGFIRIATLDDVDGMIASLNQIWIGSYKLRFYRAKGFNAKDPSNSQKSSSPKEFLNRVSYADVVKGDEKPKVIPLESCVPDYRKEKTSMNPNVPSSSQCTNHVEVSMENGVLVIKINLGELLSLNDSDSSMDTASCSKKETLRMNSILEIKKSNFDVEEPTKTCNLPTNPSPLKDRMNLSNSEEATKDSNAVQDLGSNYGMDSNEDSKLGSPCFSVHTRSTEGINFAGGIDLNNKDMSCNTISGEECLQMAGEDNVDVVSRDNEAFEGRIPPDPMDPNADIGKENEEVIGKGDECADESEHEEDCLGQVYIDKVKIPRKKKRKNHKWSKKKSHSKVVYCIPTPVITDSDMCISDGAIRNRNSLYDEALKTLEISKLLGLSWENDDLVIQKVMEQEQELLTDYEKGC